MHHERECLTASTELQIYYIQGRADIAPGSLGRHFIGNWEEDGYSFLFFSKPARETIDGMLNTRPDLVLLDAYQMRYEDWLGERFEAFHAGGFYITPPTGGGQYHPDDRTIRLDPGVVFGTGGHPTTRHCLELIARVCGSARIETAVDIGTGTGLLALAAARMGCGRVLALDANYLAAQTTRRNVLLNGLADVIVTVQARAETWARPCDLLIANIHFDVMKHLISGPAFAQAQWFILSGLLRSQARDIAGLLTAKPVTIIETAHSDGIWHTFLGRKSQGHQGAQPATC